MATRDTQAAWSQRERAVFEALVMPYMSIVASEELLGQRGSSKDQVDPKAFKELESSVKGLHKITDRIQEGSRNKDRSSPYGKGSGKDKGKSPGGKSSKGGEDLSKIPQDLVDHWTGKVIAHLGTKKCQDLGLPFTSVQDLYSDADRKDGGDPAKTNRHAVSVAMKTSCVNCALKGVQSSHFWKSCTEPCNMQCPKCEKGEFHWLSRCSKAKK